MRPVLVSRAEPGATHSVEALRKRGVKAIKAPTADILFLDKRLNMCGVSALVFTSANGVRAYTRVSKRFDVPAFCVGTATANLARSFGFDQVLCADGDGEALARLIERHPPEGEMVHVRGDDVGFELVEGLTGSAIKLRSEILYRAVMVASFQPIVWEVLKEHPVVLIYSSKGAERFLTLADDADLSKVSFVVISKAASLPLRDQPCAGVTIAKQPKQASLFDALDAVLSAR